jgi:hypothetical protein
MSRVPVKKVIIYPRVDVFQDEKAPEPNNYYAEVAFRLQGIRIETWRMSQSKAMLFAANLQRQLREDPNGGDIPTG